jgi:hypothetical protein
MSTKQLVAGAAIVGGLGLNLVGLAVNADASPPVVSNEPDPPGPTFTIEPAPSAPSSDIASDPGTASSTDTGSAVSGGPPSDLGVGAPSDLPPTLDVPNSPPPIAGPTGPGGPPDQSAGAPSDLPIPSGPPRIEGPTNPAGPSAANAPQGAPLNPGPSDPNSAPADLGHGCRPLWCPHPPNPPDPPSQPYWPWPDPFWPETSDPWESTTVLPSPCVGPPPRPDAPPPPPFQYGGQPVSPAFDGGLRQWGFWYFGSWVPLFGSECQMPANTGTAEPHT